MSVRVNSGAEQYKPLLEQVLSDVGYSVKSSEYAYSVVVTIRADREVFADTIVVQPAIALEVTDGSESVLSFSTAAERISGFKDAEKFIDTKVYNAITTLIEQAVRAELCKL